MVNPEALKKIIVEQREQFLRLQNPIPRDVILAENFSKIVSLKEAIIVTGVRRSGKSYLLQMIWQKIAASSKTNKDSFLYINFEDERLIKFTAQDFDNLLNLYHELFPGSEKFKSYLFFDEIQVIASWEKFINRLLRQEKYKVFITGSNASLLSGEIGTALTGRVFPLSLFPFSFKEFLRHRFGHELDVAEIYKPTALPKIKRAFNEYVQNGGFPEVILQKFRPLLQEYLKNIIYRDIILRYKIKNEVNLREIVSFVVSNIGASLSLENIAKMTKMRNLMTVKNYLSYLGNSFLFYRVPQYSHSIKKQIYNPDKFYCVDTGFYNEVAFATSANRGRLLENLVCLELARRGEEVFYYQGKKECDFIIKEKNKVIAAIQVTTFLGDSNRGREVDGLFEAMKKYNIRQGLILTEGQSEVFEENGLDIQVKPIWQWCLRR